MIDWINRISFTGFHDWLVSAIHPLILLVAGVLVTLGLAFYYSRRVSLLPDDRATAAHVSLLVIASPWTLLCTWITTECFVAHGVSGGEPTIAVFLVAICLYLWAVLRGITWGYIEDE